MARIVQLLLSLSLFVGVTPRLVYAQTIPAKIKLVIPWSAGDSINTAKKFTPIFAKHMGVPVELTTVSGGYGQTALDLVHAAKPNGETLMFGSTSDLIYRMLSNPDAATRWDDMTLVDLILFQPLGCVLSPNSRYQTINEVIDSFRLNKQPVQLLSSARESLLFPAFLLRQFGLSLKEVKFVKVPQGKKILQTMSESPNLMTCIAVNTIVLNYKDDKFTHLITNSVRPIKAAPKLLLARDLGVKNLETFRYWNILLAPKGLPKELQKKIKSALVKMNDDPEWQSYLESVHATSAINKVAQLPKFLNEESMFFEKIAILTKWMGE